MICIPKKWRDITTEIRETAVAHINKVLCSINQAGDYICVDVFVRPNETYGFEEYRREPEDGRGWYAIGYHVEKRFESFDAAFDAARSSIPWLARQTD